VKRWGKSPPLEEQSTRHGKPHREQGQIGDHGAARSSSRSGGMGPGYWLLRQMILATTGASWSRNRIRLTTLPKPLKHLTLQRADMSTHDGRQLVFGEVDFCQLHAETPGHFACRDLLDDM